MNRYHVIAINPNGDKETLAKCESQYLAEKTKAGYESIQSGASFLFPSLTFEIRDCMPGILPLDDSERVQA